MTAKDSASTPRIVVRPEARTLRVGGARVHVEPRVFDLLLALAEAGGAVVGKDVLIGRVWQGRAVSDDALAAAVRDLRRALGDDGRRQRVVQTVYGRGFRLAGGIDLDRPGRRPGLVVLPIAAEAAPHHAQALTLDITAALARTGSFAVINAQSVRALPAGTEASAHFAVDYALNGTLQQGALTLLLTRTHTAEVLWADRIERPLQRIVAGIADLADTIAARVETEVIAHAAAEAKLRPIHDLDAWSAYHRAVRTMMQFRIEDAAEVEALLTHAARRDGRSARIRAAQSHLAWQRAFLASGADRTEAGAHAIDLAQAALDLDAHDPQAHWALGRALLIDGKTGRARASLRRAIALNPSFANAHYALGWTMSHDGTPQADALTLPRTARRLSPLDPIRYAFDLLEADLSFFAGDLAAARRLAQDAAHHPGAHHQARAIASWLLHATGATEDALRLAASVRRTRPGYGFSDYCAAVPARGHKRATVERHFRALGY